MLTKAPLSVRQITFIFVGLVAFQLHTYIFINVSVELLPLIARNIYGVYEIILLGYLVSFFSIVLTLLVGYAVTQEKLPFAVVGRTVTSLEMAKWVAWLLLVWLALYVLYQHTGFAEWLTKNFSGEDASFDSDIGRSSVLEMGVSETILSFIVTVIVGPLSEELAIRGGLFAILKYGKVPDYLILIITTAAFVSYHSHYPVDGLFMVTVLGTFLGVVRLKSNSLPATWGVHSLWNALARI